MSTLTTVDLANDTVQGMRDAHTVRAYLATLTLATLRGVCDLNGLDVADENRATLTRWLVAELAV